MDQIFTLKQAFEKAWEYGQPIFMAFVDLEKAYDRVPRDKLWECLVEYGLSGELLRAIQSLYWKSSSCVRINGLKSEPFTVNTGLRQGCVLSPLLFITYMDRISKSCVGPEGVTFGDTTLSKLFFADDLALLAILLVRFILIAQCH